MMDIITSRQFATIIGTIIMGQDSELVIRSKYSSENNTHLTELLVNEIVVAKRIVDATGSAFYSDRWVLEGAVRH